MKGPMRPGRVVSVKIWESDVDASVAFHQADPDGNRIELFQA